MKSSPPPIRNGFSRMILDDQIFRARAVHADRKKRLAAIRTRQQAEAYRDEVADKIGGCFGKFPSKTPLDARVTGSLDFQKFRIEKVVFSSRPGLWVTANLYLPKGLREPAPAILGHVGHYLIGMAAPSCWVNSFLAVIENEVGGDAEQSPPGALGKGLEHGDFFLARVPEPALIIGQKHDFFDRRSLQETSEEVARIYRLFGAGDHFGHFIGENTHGYFPDARTAMRKFFCRHFQVRPPKRFSLTIHRPEKLFVLPGGSVSRAGGRSARELFREATVVPEKRWSAAALSKAIRRVLHLPAGKRGLVTYRNLRGDWLPGGRLFGRYALATEPRYETILRKVIPPATGLTQALFVEKEVLLYLPHWSCHADFIRVPAARKLLTRAPLYAVEVRGIGESMCQDRPDVEVHYWMDYLAQSFDGLLGGSLLGRRVFDVLRTCDLLAQEGASRIRLVGRGQGALLAAFAAALDPRIISAELHEAPGSFAEWLEKDDLEWPAADCPQGILKAFDLPALYETFSRKISVVSPWRPQAFPPDSDL